VEEGKGNREYPHFCTFSGITLRLYYMHSVLTNSVSSLLWTKSRLPIPWKRTCRPGLPCKRTSCRTRCWLHHAGLLRREQDHICTYLLGARNVLVRVVKMSIVSSYAYHNILIVLGVKCLAPVQVDKKPKPKSPAQSWLYEKWFFSYFFFIIGTYVYWAKVEMVYYYDLKLKIGNIQSILKFLLCNINKNN